jgi:cytochrome c-type biogenesis protein CcmH
VRRLWAIVLVAAGLVSAAPAFAVQPDEMLKDPVLEARARALSEELRCLVCQNQSIDDSDAPLAHDIRVLLRERLTAGDTDEQAIDFLVARYGEFILLKPPFNAHTWLLWLVPPGVLLIGGLATLRAWAKVRGRPSGSPDLSNNERETLKRLIADPE